MLSLINSSISHEMRNPLNSIINECKIMGILIANLAEILKAIKNLLINVNVYSQIQDIIEKILKGNNVQTSSS